jgi:hypothetical protein
VLLGASTEFSVFLVEAPTHLLPLAYSIAI